MGSGIESPFNPFEEMDPDNINYIHSIDYDQVQDLIRNLPDGWVRIEASQLESGQPPYLHEPSGQTSWKNPNFDKVMTMADSHRSDTQDAKRKIGGISAMSNAKQVKKLRLMLQAGAPLGAVEQKAKLEGIDMSLVLSPSKFESGDGADQMEDGATMVMIPETLLKKYKRMRKAGLPLDRVQQLAGIEAGVSPEQVALILKEEEARECGSDSCAEEGWKKKGEVIVEPRMAKFVKMQKAGLPLAAIQNAAKLQGFNVDEVNAALGLSESVANTELKIVIPKSNVVEFDSKIVESDEMAKHAVDGVESTELPPFIALGDTVKFPSSKGRSNPLTDLVRKMVQTVEKTARFNNHSSPTEMIVNNMTLFDALGSLRGVQFARDEFNSSIKEAGVVSKSRELVHAKCHGFVEMAKSIGMSLPEVMSEPVDIHGLDDLVSRIELVNQDEILRGTELMNDGYYDFDSLHVLYTPGSYVVAKHAGGGGTDCISQVVWNRYTQGKTILGKPMRYFQLCVRFIVPVGGGKTTFAEVVEGMEVFEGKRSLWASAGAGMGLSFVPIHGNDEGNILQQYKRRGDLYNKIVSSNDWKGGKMHSYLEYQKGCFYQKSGGSFNAKKASAALATGGRIVVDFDAAVENGYSLTVGRDDMIEGFQLKLKEYKMHLRSMDQDDEIKNHQYDSAQSVSSGEMILFSQIPDEFCAMTWPNLIGFSLTSKSWGDVAIDGLNEIHFDKDIFDRLVLADKIKRMIKALVKHTNADAGFHDLVKGKGEGTVFLLYGPPGLGKTLTAESVADFLERPLFSISMGTLGTTADELERRLGEILQLSARWNAILLLDEADSFLESRSSNSPLERNAMVSVMLRLVEYHQGILFLTSNRIDSLDPAFQTRITLALRYEALDLGGRAKVWENLLVKSGYEQVLESFDLMTLAKTPLNGREIKNALRLAMAMAVDEGVSLSQNLLAETTIVVHDQKNNLRVDWDDEEVNHGCLWSWWH